MTQLKQQRAAQAKGLALECQLKSSKFVESKEARREDRLHNGSKEPAAGLQGARAVAVLLRGQLRTRHRGPSASGDCGPSNGN
jgi:hypothetical protein